MRIKILKNDRNMLEFKIIKCEKYRRNKAMRNINIILVCMIIALLSGGIGFMIGMNMKANITTTSTTSNSLEVQNDKNNDEINLVGTYKTNTWNGKEAVLVLNADKTMIHPTGNRGIWLLEDGKLYIEFETEFSTFDESETQTKTTKSRQEVTIVDSGLMINTHFFKRIK